MKKIWIFILVLAVLIIGLISKGLSFYGTLVKQDESLKSIEAQVNNMYERRKDLVPQVAAVVKNYAQYESGVLVWVTSLRSQVPNVDTLNQMVANGDYKSSEFSSLLAQTMWGIKVTLENYPQLKADSQFTNLYTTLEGSENRIRTAIMDYNNGVVAYNQNIRSIPRWVVFSRLFGRDYKERINPPTDKDIKEVPDVDRLLN